MSLQHGHAAITEAVVVQPAPHHRVHKASQILQALVVARGLAHVVNILDPDVIARRSSVHGSERSLPSRRRYLHARR